MLMAIVSGDVTTNRAFLAGMSGINIDHGDTTFGGFVFDKATELPERPRVLDLPLLPSYPDTVADVFQVFHHVDISGFTGLNNRLADPVVEVGHPSPLFARQPFQEVFCSGRAFGLQRLPQFGVMLPDVHGLPSGEFQTVGGGGDVVDATVNANNVTVFGWEGNFTVDHDMDIELFGSTVVAECSRSKLLSGEKTTLEVADVKFKFEPAVYGGNRNLFPFLDKREGAGVEAHTGGLELPGLGLFTLLFGCFGDPGNSTDNKVSVEAVLFLNSVVAKMLQFHFVSCFVVQRNL